MAQVKYFNNIHVYILGDLINFMQAIHCDNGTDFKAICFVEQLNKVHYVAYLNS